MYIILRKYADVGTSMQLYQILNTERYVKSNDDTDIPEIRS